MTGEGFDYSVHYDKMSESSNPAALWIARRYFLQMGRWLPKSKTTAILELGPGNGLTLLALNNAGYTPTGIEADKVLAERLAAKGLSVCWVSAKDTTQYLLERPESFDFIFAHHVLEHVPVDEQMGLVNAISGALRPGGHFLCETPNALSPVANWYRYGDWTHTTIFTSASLEFILAAGGLVPVYVGATIGGRGPSFGKPARAAIEWMVSGLALCVSRLIQRIHLVGECRIGGLRVPITAALLGVGCKR